VKGLRGDCGDSLWQLPGLPDCGKVIRMAENPDLTVRIKRSDWKRIGWAFVISIILHVMIFGGYRAGQRFGWWQNLHLPAWLDPAKQLAALTKSKTEKGLSLPIRIPFGWGSGLSPGQVPFILQASFTFVYCRDDNTGTCRIKTFNWRAPVEVVNDPTVSNEIRLNGKVTAE